MSKKAILKETINHIDIKSFNAIPIVDQFNDMAFSARTLARASYIYDDMIKDKKCSIFLCLAGSLISAGLKAAIYDLLKNNMIDAIISTGANIVDQDFFEGLGYRHYKGDIFANDDALMKQNIDRIYDTYIDEDELLHCDATVAKIAQELEPRPYSSREFIAQMGKYLKKNNLGKDSIVRLAYEKNVPIFVPAFSDCSAGLGLANYQHKMGSKPKVTIDSVQDFLELTKIKIAAGETGLFMLAGGVPKNFAQDTTVMAEILTEKEAKLHKYAVQITVADERDGALSGSTLREAHSWGKVGEENEQMVYAEATMAFPLIASYVYHKKNWKDREPKNYGKIFNTKK
ncbi:MAG: deoxyhypusine synthase [Candidatus Paceibacterota bacterium]